jgi:hypothetical protein
MHTVEVWRWVKSGLQVCELAVERGDGVFEHFPVCRGARAAEVVACACPRQFERTPALFSRLLLRRHLRASLDLSSGRLFLLGFHRLGLKAARHASFYDA